MTWLYATCLTVLAAAFILTPHMKRAGEDEWRRWQAAQARALFAQRMNAMQDSMVRLTREMQKFTPAMRKVSDRVDAMTLALYGVSKLPPAKPVVYDEFPEEGTHG